MVKDCTVSIRHMFVGDRDDTFVAYFSEGDKEASIVYSRSMHEEVVRHDRGRKTCRCSTTKNLGYLEFVTKDGEMSVHDSRGVPQEGPLFGSKSGGEYDVTFQPGWDMPEYTASFSDEHFALGMFKPLLLIPVRHKSTYILESSNPSLHRKLQLLLNFSLVKVKGHILDRASMTWGLTHLDIPEGKKVFAFSRMVGGRMREVPPLSDTRSDNWIQMGSVDVPYATVDDMLNYSPSSRIVHYAEFLFDIGSIEFGPLEVLEDRDWLDVLDVVSGKRILLVSSQDPDRLILEAIFSFSSHNVFIPYSRYVVLKGNFSSRSD